MRTNLFLRWLRKTFCCFRGHNFFISTSSYQSFLKIYLLRESLGKLQSKMCQCRTLAHVRCQKWQREYEIIELNYTASWMIITYELYIRHSGVLYTGCFTAARVRGPVYWEQSEGRERQGQSDLCNDCGDERSFHFGCLDNGDFSPLESISLSFRLYQGNYSLSQHVKMVVRWLHNCSNRGCYRGCGRTKELK